MKSQRTRRIDMGCTDSKHRMGKPGLGACATCASIVIAKRILAENPLDDAWLERTFEHKAYSRKNPEILYLRGHRF